VFYIDGTQIKQITRIALVFPLLCKTEIQVVQAVIDLIITKNISDTVLNTNNQ